jgi:hypothetical protein
MGIKKIYLFNQDYFFKKQQQKLIGKPKLQNKFHIKQQKQ